jgi:ATP-dependent Clp protease ATP-binding subunit ClpX
MIRIAETSAPDFDIFPTPSEIVRFLDEHIVGQEEPKQALASAVYSHYLMGAAAKARGIGERRRTTNLLFAGPTGTGKTESVRLIAEFLGVPFAYMPATALTQEGYIGSKPNDIIRDLLSAANWNEDRAELGIVFLDEIDKVRRTGSPGSLDVSGEGVQMSLLPFLDGTDYSVRRGDTTYSVNTRNILIIAAGAFQLQAPALQVGQPAANSELATLSLNDLADYGLIDEFIGRFSRVINYQSLTPQELKRILLTSGPLKDQQELFDLHQVQLHITTDAAEYLAQRAADAGTGARALGASISEHLQEAVAGLPHLQGTKVTLAFDSEHGVHVKFEGSPRTSTTAADRIRRVLPLLIRNDSSFSADDSDPESTPAIRYSDRPTITYHPNLEEFEDDFYR